MKILTLADLNRFAAENRLDPETTVVKLEIGTDAAWALEEVYVESLKVDTLPRTGERRIVIEKDCSNGD